MPTFGMQNNQYNKSIQRDKIQILLSTLRQKNGTHTQAHAYKQAKQMTII
jgi:hypothetical protein